jgi:diadenylate cyclase
MMETLALCAPGSPLRAGIDRILLARRGALVVLGDDPSVLSVSTGGFLLDAEFTPQRLGELAKMDGAIVLTHDARRIARANVHLTPRASVQTSETGTRHRTAERVAKSLGVGVITVSAAMSTISVFVGDAKRTLEPPARLIDRASQALTAMQRFRERFDASLRALSAAELVGSVGFEDVIDVLQPALVLARIADDVAEELVELGAEGRIVALQLAELTEGVEEPVVAVITDYVPVGQGQPGARAQEAFGALRQLEGDELHDREGLAALLGLDARTEENLVPRGYRSLLGVPRLSPVLVERLVVRFGSLAALRAASPTDLGKVEGVGQARARSIRHGLARLEREARPGR